MSFQYRDMPGPKHATPVAVVKPTLDLYDAFMTGSMINSDSFSSNYLHYSIHKCPARVISCEYW